MPATPAVRPGRRPDLALRQLWQDRLRLFERSGLSAAAFCARQRLPLAAFHHWKRRLRPLTATTLSPQRLSRNAPPPLIPIDVLPPTAQAVPVEIVLPGGAVLRLAPGCDLAFVRALVQTLGGSPC
jgi:hypothetical protein